MSWLDNDEQFRQALTPIWQYLTVTDEPKPADAVIVIGSMRIHVERRAAELFRQGLAPVIVTTGGHSAETLRDQRVRAHGETEAAMTKKSLIGLGVPADRILVESYSHHTGENVSLGVERLRQAGITPKRLLLVAKSWHTRRAKATFNIQFPTIEILCCPSENDLLPSVDRPRNEFAVRLCAELDRLRQYADQGFIAAQDIPPPVDAACTQARNFLKLLP